MAIRRYGMYGGGRGVQALRPQRQHHPCLLYTSFRRTLRGQDALAAAVAFGGIALVAPVSGGGAWQGVLWGLLSGLSYALLGLLNKKTVDHLPAPVISFYEQAAAAVYLLPSLLWLRPRFTLGEVGLLALLGVVFTAISHTLFIGGLKGVRAQTASEMCIRDRLCTNLFMVCNLAWQVSRVKGQQRQAMNEALSLLRQEVGDFDEDLFRDLGTQPAVYRFERDRQKEEQIAQAPVSYTHLAICGAHRRRPWCCTGNKPRLPPERPGPLLAPGPPAPRLSLIHI